MISWGYRLGIFASSWAVAASSAVAGKWYLDGDLSESFILGNYEGYISEDLYGEMRGTYGVSLDHFDYDHVVKEKFQRGIYDAAIVSTSVLLDLKKNNLLQKIDWGKLNIQNGSKEKIDNKDKAKEIFSELVKKILKTEDSFLEYGMPYFLNKLSFCYTGDEIGSLKTKVTWKDLIKAISNEDRFKSRDGRPRLALIDDPRTVLSMAKLVTNDPTDVNLSKGEKALSIYNNLKKEGLKKNNMGRNFLLMSPSSSTIIDSLASGSIEGGFMYNGDCLYAAKGGNVKKKPEKFNIVETEQNIYFLDFIVFSKGLSGNKLERAYDFSKKLLFEGMDEDDVLAKDNGEYKYAPIRNFDYVQYTPVLEKPLKKIEATYFEGETDDPLKDIKKKILSIATTSPDSLTNFYERPFATDRQKSDVFRDFEKFKLSL